MPNRYLRLLFPPIALFFITSLLTGCVLSRVSESAHAKEVDELHVVGMSLDAARAAITQRGYTCSPYAERHLVSTEDGDHQWLQTTCDKQSMEVICPQIRSVVLNVDPTSQKVVMVGKNITQNACF